MPRVMIYFMSVVEAEPVALFDLRDVETFITDHDSTKRCVLLRSGEEIISELPGVLTGQATPHYAFDKAWLTLANRPFTPSSRPPVRVVDLFAGCGGLSVGVEEACRAVGRSTEHVLANDLDPEILEIYGRNFPEAELVAGPVESLLDGEVRSAETSTERRLRTSLGEIDLLIGGPPCQGHSALNNHTRHNDPKNDLYLRMARFCEVIRPTHVIIENVPGVERDAHGAARLTRIRLEELGYAVASGTIDASTIGVAQRRKRNFTLGSLLITPNFANAASDLRVDPRTVRWAIDDLVQCSSSSVFDSAPTPSSTNRGRMDLLFNQDIFDLPDAYRPDCHRLKQHSYVSVYGRMHWDRPAQTITTGFGSMGRGRFVHPSKRRTITPHEAARIQSFPDFYNFGSDKRTLLQTVIGNAVPPKLGYVIALHLLR